MGSGRGVHPRLWFFKEEKNLCYFREKALWTTRDLGWASVWSRRQGSMPGASRHHGPRRKGSAVWLRLRGTEHVKEDRAVCTRPWVLGLQPYMTIFCTENLQARKGMLETLH